MATPQNAAYKKAQRAAESAYDNRGKVIWVSCEILKDRLGFSTNVKRTIQGTCRIYHNQQQLRGKAAIKAAKKLSHAKRWYRVERSLMGLARYFDAIGRICN